MKQHGPSLILKRRTSIIVQLFRFGDTSTGTVCGRDVMACDRETISFKNGRSTSLRTSISPRLDDGCQVCRPRDHRTPPTAADIRRTAPGLIDVVCLKGVGHWIQHEASDRLSAELLRFLEVIEPAGSLGATP